MTSPQQVGLVNITCVCTHTRHLH